MALPEFRKGLGPYTFQALSGVVTMDFLDVELAHEVDGFLSDDLARHHDRKARRVWNHEARRDQFRTVFQAPIDLRVGQANVFAPGCVIGRIESTADIALVGLLAGI